MSVVDSTPRPDGDPIERSSIRKNVGVMATSQVTTWIFATLTAVVVPRYLGPETQGGLALASALWYVAMVFAGLGTALYLQLAIARDQQAGLRLLAPVLAVRTLAFAAGTVAVVGYLAATGADRTITTFAAFVGVGSLFGLWAEVYNTSFMGLERMSTVAWLSVIVKFSGLAATIAVILLDLGVYALLGSGLAFGLFALVGIVWRFHRVARFDTTEWRSKALQVVKGGLPYLAVALALAFYRQVDVLVIAEVAGERDLGWYSAADTLFGSLLFPTTIVLASIFPTLGRLHEHDPPEMRRLVTKTFALLVLISVPVGLGAAVVGEQTALLLFGAEFSGTGALMTIFGPVTILTFGTTFLATVSMAQDRRRFVALMLLASAALTIPLDIVLVPWAADRYDNGAIGGALAFLVTETLQFVVGLAVIAPYIVTRSWCWRTVRVLAAGGVMFAAAWPFRDSFLLVPVVVGAVVYPVAILALRALDDDQRELMRDALRRAPVVGGRFA